MCRTPLTNVFNERGCFKCQNCENGRVASFAQSAQESNKRSARLRYCSAHHNMITALATKSESEDFGLADIVRMPLP